MGFWHLGVDIGGTFTDVVACDARPDKPVVGGNHEASRRIADATFRALAPTVPERVTARGADNRAAMARNAHTGRGWTT